MKDLKQPALYLLVFMIGIAATLGYQAFNNPVSSFSGALNVLNEHGNVYVLDSGVSYEPRSAAFSIIELEALTKVASLREGMYINTPPN